MMERNKIYNIDAIELMKSLPDKSIDIIVTDPPYGLEYNQNDLASQREAAFGGKRSQMKPNGIKTDGEDESMLLFENFLIEANRILVNGGCCCCCCCGGGPKPLFAKWTLLMDKIIGFKQAVVWDKIGLGMGIHFRRSYEFMLIAQKGNPVHAWNGGHNTSNVWRMRKIIPSKFQHPTEKPIELMARCIRLFSNEGDTVLNPFCGSGVTLEAAITMKRNFIGTDIDKKFYDMSMKRLEPCLQQYKMF